MAKDDSGTSGVGLPVGTKIGKYEVRQRLGVGGQSIVYKCHDELLDRFVAVKQISSHLAEDPKFLQRFRREAQTLAKLGAEIITIHELIEDTRGLFIVMEYVEGHTLETVLNDTPGPVETKAALQILWRLAATLHEVHTAGIIHRDLKPGNIIISEGLRPKITDFGVAASISGQTSMILGTTKYMAPELFEGGEVDARADMYSLGFIVYEMLVGRPQFNEIFADVVRDKHSEALRWMKWHGNEKVHAPGACDVNSSVPRELSDIVDKMIAKNPNERFASMEELGKAIKMAFSPRGRAAGRASATEQALARRGRAVAKAAARAAMGGGRIGPGDEADELEIIAQPPATAPLPKSTFSLRTKLILIGVIVASLIGIAVILGVQASRSERQRQADADKIYTAAMDAYRAGLTNYEQARFASALGDFEKLLKDAGLAGTPAARKAAVRVHFCRGHLAVLKEQWSQAAEAEQDAADAVNRAESDDKLPEEWIAERRMEIANFRQYWQDTRVFVRNMADARQAFQAGKLAEAREILRTRLGQIHFTARQQKLFEDFQKQIDLAQFMNEYEAQVDRGDRLVAKNNFKQAVAAYQSAESLLNSDAASILPAERRKALRAALSKRMADVGVSSEYRQAMDKAADARQVGDLAEELKWMLKANQIMPSPGNRKAIAQLRSNIALAEGKTFEADGEYESAREKYNEALKHNPDNSLAKAALTHLKNVQQRLEFLKAGDAALSAGQYAEALDKYRQAAKIRGDETLTEKIVECNYQIQLAKARALHAAGKFAEARAAYDRCARIKPAAKAQITAIIAKMDQDQRYKGFLAAGDDALKRKDFKTAAKNYQQAKGIYDNEEVARRISLAKYSENIEIGKKEMAQQRYASALGYFTIAQSYRDTREVQELIQQAQKKREE